MEYKHKLLLIDGHALFHRAFHALPAMVNSEGFPTGAVFGFFSMLFKAFADIKPTHALVTFDLPGQTFRHQMAGDYKATRKPAADELLVQLPKVKEILAAFNIPVYEKPGYEADDLLGLIANKTGKDTFNIIVTGDLDLLQLINSNTEVYRFKIGFSDIVVYNQARMQEEFGISASQWVDYKAIKGDASDNIPGVPGIGPKGALELVKTFGNLDGIYAAAEKQDKAIKPGTLKKLLENKDKAYLSYKLSKLEPENHFEFNLEDAHLRDYDKNKIINLFEQLSIRALNNRLPVFGGTQPSIKPVRQSNTSANLQSEQSIEVSLKPAAEEEFELLDSKVAMENLIKLLAKSRGVALKHVFGKEKEKDQFKGIAFAVSVEKAYFLPILDGDKSKLELFREVLENNSIEKWGHDLKTTARILWRFGIGLKPLSFDTLIAAYLLNPGRRNYDVPQLLQTIQEKPQLEARLKQKGLNYLFNEIEIPLMQVLLNMEKRGVCLDLDWLYKLSLLMETRINQLIKQIHNLAGEEFNISSPIQLREVLFEKLRIPTENLKKTGKTKALSTAAGELEKLRGLHPIVDLIFEYRELTKLKSTYVDALPVLVSKTDSRLHTSFNQTIAATGRLSSSDPNLQNIPIRSELGNEVRKSFVSSKDKVLLSLDYSQIELRIAAALSQDPEMMRIFKAGGDFHAATASRIFNVKESEVTPNMRRAAKTINFGVLYGVSAFGLSERTEMERAEAADYINKYYQVFSRLKTFIDNLIQTVHENGFVRNELGRIRYFPEIKSQNRAIRTAAERAAVNMPIQSLAADIIKISMIQVEKLLEKEPDCQMLLSVHDELVFEVPEDKAKDCTTKIKKVMESAYKLSVPLVVEAKVGKNWSEMKLVK